MGSEKLSEQFTSATYSWRSDPLAWILRVARLKKFAGEGSDLVLGVYWWRFEWWSEMTVSSAWSWVQKGGAVGCGGNEQHDNSL